MKKTNKYKNKYVIARGFYSHLAVYIILTIFILTVLAFAISSFAYFVGIPFSDFPMDACNSESNDFNVFYCLVINTKSIYHSLCLINSMGYNFNIKTIYRQIKKGLLQRSARVVVVGLPNVGKSSFINKLVRCAKTKVAAKAGVTKEHSWVRINPKLDLLDTPGVIPMKIENQEVAIKLASISSIGENAFDKEFVSCEILKLLDEEYIPIVKKHYNLSENDDLSLENIAKSRNLILKNSVLDIRRCCEMFLKDFSLGKIGRFTLD